jgi:hypothetical protein
MRGRRAARFRHVPTPVANILAAIQACQEPQNVTDLAGISSHLENVGLSGGRAMGAASVDVSPAVICVVEAARSGASIRLRGRIAGREAESRFYRRKIIRESRGGSSRVARSGRFSTSAREPARVGSTAADFAPAARMLARLGGEALAQSFTRRCEEKPDE